MIRWKKGKKKERGKRRNVRRKKMENENGMMQWRKGKEKMMKKEN